MHPSTMARGSHRGERRRFFRRPPAELWRGGSRPGPPRPGSGSVRRGGAGGSASPAAGRKKLWPSSSWGAGPLGGGGGALGGSPPAAPPPADGVPSERSVLMRRGVPLIVISPSRACRRQAVYWYAVQKNSACNSIAFSGRICNNLPPVLRNLHGRPRLSALPGGQQPGKIVPGGGGHGVQGFAPVLDEGDRLVQRRQHGPVDVLKSQPAEGLHPVKIPLGAGHVGQK